MLLMKIRPPLELASKSQDAIFRKRPADDLQSDRKTIHKSAGNADGGKTAEIAGLHKSGDNAFPVGALRRYFIERLVGAIWKIEARRRNQQIYAREPCPESRLYLRADSHGLEVVERRIIHGGFEAVDLALIRKLIDATAAYESLKYRGSFGIDDAGDELAVGKVWQFRFLDGHADGFHDCERIRK